MSEIESKLDELAWLSLTKPDALAIEDHGLSQDDLGSTCDFSNGRLCFQDLEEAKARAIRHIRQTVIAPVVGTPQALFEALQRCWLSSGSASEDNLCGLALAQSHNAGEVDALQVAIEAGRAEGNAFAVSRVISESLPSFDWIDIPNLLILVGSVGAQGLLHYAVGEWLQRHTVAIDDVVQGCLAIGSDAIAPLLRTALIRGVAANRLPWLARIHALAADDNQSVSLAAIEALGLIDWSGAEAREIEEAVAVIRAGLQAADERLVTTAMGAGLNLVGTAVEQHGLIDEIAALDRPDVVHRIAEQLAYHGEHLKSQPWYLQKVDLLAGKSGQDEGAYHGLDQILTTLYKSSEKHVCLQWIDTWAVANADNAPSLPGQFDGLFEALARDGEELGALLARWLAHDEIGIVAMARKILDDLSLHAMDGLAFPVSALNGMSAQGLLHLVRRVLANVLREEQRISLVWSLTRAASAETRTYPLVRDAMVNFVGYDYPTATLKHLESVIAADAEAPVGALARQILEELKKYYDALDALPTIEELRPQSEHRHRFAKEHQRLMNKAYEEASKNSIIRQIATTIHLKAGRSSFSMRDGAVGEKMHMMSATHSMSLPRSESIDRVGSDLQRVHANLDKGRGEP